MRASKQEQAGAVGQNEVAAKFERIGWGVAPNPDHDLGTDLWLMARDERLFDLGLLVGVQVKGGPTWFEVTEKDAEGDVVGWWFYESDRKHFDAWLAHSVPHLVVLHHMKDAISYWAHVTPEAVKSTGKGAKILVPRVNIVDHSCFQALLKIASGGRPPSQWEGSAWTGAAALAPKDRFRHALITPRLVAPHRNAGFNNKPRSDQVLALLAQARVREVEFFAERHESVPTLQEAKDSKDWDWRFVAAFGHLLTEESREWLQTSVNDAESPAQRTVASVALATSFLREGRPDEAIKVLEGAMSPDDAEPVDNAWLTAQLARAYVEVGRLEEAKQHALQSQSVRSTHPDDVTAGAIAAAAAALVFNISDSRSSEIANLIQVSDTASTWWRTQIVSWGLTSSLERSYRDWSRDTAVFLFGPDNGHDDLFAAALIASHAGDHGAWQHLCTVQAKSDLLEQTRISDSQGIASLLTELLSAGDSNALGLAATHIIDEGPAVAAAEAAKSVDPLTLTHTTSQAGLELVHRAADVLDGETADRLTEWLLSTLRDPKEFIQRTRPRYDILNQVTATLSGVVRSCNPDRAREVLEFVLALPPQTDQSQAIHWERVVRAIPEDAWTTDHLAVAMRRASSDHRELKFRLLGIASMSDEAAAVQLLEEIGVHQLAALPYVADVRDLPPSVVTILVAEAAKILAGDIESAKRRGYSTRSFDPAHALTVLNIWHPQSADWNSLFAQLGEPTVRGEQKIAALRTLALSADRLPAAVQAELLAVALSVVNRPDRQEMFPDRDLDERGFADALAATLDPVYASTVDVGTYLQGDESRRESAAFLAGRVGRSSDIGVLSVLTTDQAPGVRAAAVAALARLVAQNRGGQAALSALAAVTRDPGTQAAKAVVGALASCDALSDHARALLDALRGHISTFVRRSAANLLGPER